MAPIKKSNHLKHKGTVLIVAMIFVVIFSALAVSMATMSGVNMQLASNQHKANSALSAAQSGLECGRYIIANTPLPSTAKNTVTVAQADAAWNTLCTRVQNQPWVSGQAQQTATTITTPAINFGAANTSFQVRFHRTDTHKVKMEGIGADGQVTRHVALDTVIAKDNEVLNYALASRGRMWLTGNTTIHGDIFSSWDRPEISPYNMTSDSAVLGTVNTVLTREQIQPQSYQMETLNADGNPIDANGIPLDNNYGDRYYSANDEVKAYHEGINYGQPYEDIPGMDIADYNTDAYDSGLATIPSCPLSLRKVEYFPHASLANGGYSMPRDGTPSSTWNKKLTRHVFENQTFTNARLPNNYNALFRNCTFEDVLYIDCSKTGSSYYNNVRFENCTYNGVIVSDTPEIFKWVDNCLYFTGTATFENKSSIQEATILAPHFNVNLGNTNPQQSENNVLTGAIVGGIVDVRGNAQIYGTIISMCDTTQWPSGYVTNIGATLDDGGSETTELGDIGVIGITPDKDQMLPSGITSPIIIKPLKDTYSEGA
ncbi:MAG: hypothetical protein A2Z38_04355 [Planctomycetes bacterium RBG_19FT_COMBO_48_8]|nr:MAG: hypothetical protein A2Z38_04355 [Planctomycetes bacterium RBG_19FT_COMBO_48_8]